MTPTEWAAPSYPRGAVNRAGWLLAQNGIAADPLVIGHALDVVNDWRSSHSFPLNTFQMTLRKRSSSICGQPIVAQRLKRTPSIIAKLRRFPRMQFSRMQDVGGARAVLTDVAEVDRLRELYRRGRARHALVTEKDYIREPKPSGYRGIHLVYRYRSDHSRRYPVLRRRQPGRVAMLLRMFRDALHVIGEDPAMRQGAYFLLVIEPDRRRLTVRSCRHRELAAGIQQYQEEEKRIAGTTGDAVLVAADSLSSLRRAYPNYFGDTQTFVQEMTRLLV